MISATLQVFPYTSAHDVFGDFTLLVLVDYRKELAVSFVDDVLFDGHGFVWLAVNFDQFEEIVNEFFVVNDFSLAISHRAA